MATVKKAQPGKNKKTDTVFLTRKQTDPKLLAWEMYRTKYDKLSRGQRGAVTVQVKKNIAANAIIDFNEKKTPRASTAPKKPARKKTTAEKLVAAVFGEKDNHASDAASYGNQAARQPLPEQNAFAMKLREFLRTGGKTPDPHIVEIAHRAGIVYPHQAFAHLEATEYKDGGDHDLANNVAYQLIKHVLQPRSYDKLECNESLDFERQAGNDAIRDILNILGKFTPAMQVGIFGSIKQRLLNDANQKAKYRNDEADVAVERFKSAANHVKDLNAMLLDEKFEA